MRRTTLWLFALPLWAACYTYAPVELATVPAGAPIRARVTSVQAARLEPLIGREVRVLDGALIGVVADSLFLEVPSAAQTVSGGGQRVLHQRIAVPSAEVREVELKSLNRTRTAIAVVGGSVVLGYILLDALNIGPGKEGSKSTNGGPEFRVPLTRF